MCLQTEGNKIDLVGSAHRFAHPTWWARYAETRRNACWTVTLPRRRNSRNRPLPTHIEENTSKFKATKSASLVGVPIRPPAAHP